MCRSACPSLCPALQSQKKAVTAYMRSKQLLLFSFARKCRQVIIDPVI